MGSRYLNLPQTGEVPSSMVDQFFNDQHPPLARKKTIQELEEEEREAREKAEIAITEALLNEDLENIEDLKNGSNEDHFPRHQVKEVAPLAG
uniref:Uncharacterized protein n=1 Tax=Meloidogyne enterolobii TaxID=390850 RepID=A0A6V7VM39_MELEN|nr:unnamed protein product [Meloidogyne enterolobii]